MLTGLKGSSQLPELPCVGGHPGLLEPQLLRDPSITVDGPQPQPRDMQAAAPVRASPVLQECFCPVAVFAPLGCKVQVRRQEPPMPTATNEACLAGEVLQGSNTFWVANPRKNRMGSVISVFQPQHKYTPWIQGGKIQIIWL